LIRVLTILLPLALLAYCLYQARRRPIFLLGVPFLQVMRHSVFFSVLKPFFVPGRWPNGVMLFWLAVAWTWCAFQSRAQTRSTRVPRHEPMARFLPEEYLFVSLAVLVLAKLVRSALGSADLSTIAIQFAPWAQLLAGYWLVRGVVRRSSSQDTAAFLLFVAVATGIGSALFIVHQGLGIHIYEGKEYLEFTFNGVQLTRTFWFFPPLLTVSLAFCCARRSWGTGTVALAIVLIVATIVSYTRSALLSVGVLIAVPLALRSFKERRGGPFLRRLSTIGAALAIIVVILVVALPTPTSYLLSRMATITHASTVVEDPNLRVRQSYLSSVATTVSDQYPLVGAPLGLADSMTENVGYWTADSTWVGVIYRTGFIGVALIMGVFVLFGIRAFGLFRSSNKTTEFLGAVYLATIIATFIGTFISWTFLSSGRYAMGFWLFAFVAGTACRRGGQVTDLHSRAGFQQGVRS
jgi:hypothetical protein